MAIPEPPLFGSAEHASSNEHTRRSNLALVLSLVHRNSGISRIELAKTTGLNRSTIAKLTAALGALGLVYEGPAAASGLAGRPSPRVHANTSTAAIAINPEMDAITVGLVGLGGTVLKQIRYETPHVPSAREASNIAAAIIEGMRSELDSHYRIMGIGAAVPGLIRASDGVVQYAPGLDWHDEPFAELLSSATGYPTRAANDASLGASGEIVFGAGRGSRNLLYLMGGASGIGGGIITKGALMTGTSGFAGEIGHSLVNSSGTRCPCGAIGCLQTEVSLARLLHALGLERADNDELAQAIAASTDPQVVTEITRQLQVLAITLRNWVNTINPERIILGGFLSTIYARAPHVLDALVASTSLDGPAQDVTILRSQLGSSILMVGAAELAFAPLLADPALHAQASA